ncbi:MAG: hypothetical protein WCO25_03440 [Candidatus Uhrbacteria bacterium]
MSLARLQELHNELREMKEERKKLKQVLKDELTHQPRHAELIEEILVLKTEKSQIEGNVREAAPKDAQRIDDLDEEIKASEELMSDMALSLIMSNKSVELKDKYENTYLPLIKVAFKKDDGGAKKDE